MTKLFNQTKNIEEEYTSINQNDNSDASYTTTVWLSRQTSKGDNFGFLLQASTLKLVSLCENETWKINS